MADNIAVRGVDDFKAKLLELPRAMRRRVLRNALAAGARLVRDEAKRNAPVLSAAYIKAPYRKPGTVRGAIRVRTSKQATRAGDVGVFVNVKPAKGSNRGGKNPNDPFYWRFLEFGTRRMSARPFLQKGGDKLQQALGVFESALGKWIAKVNDSGRVQP